MQDNISTCFELLSNPDQSALKMVSIVYMLLYQTNVYNWLVVLNSSSGRENIQYCVTISKSSSQYADRWWLSPSMATFSFDCQLTNAICINQCLKSIAMLGYVPCLSWTVLTLYIRRKFYIPFWLNHHLTHFGHDPHYLPIPQPCHAGKAT